MGLFPNEIMSGNQKGLLRTQTILSLLDYLLDSLTSAADDQDILRIAKELIEQLNISGFRPVSVSWAEDVPLTLHDSENILPEMAGVVKRDVPVGCCVFTWDRVLLPTEIKGKLGSEEWRPLLASSLIYEAKLRIKRYLGIIFVSIPIIIDALGWWELFAVSTPASGIPALLLILDVAWLLPAFFLSGFLAKWFSRRLRLKADKIAAEFLGKRNIVEIAGENESPRTGRSVCGSKLGHFSTEQVSIHDGAHEWEAHFDREDYQPQPKPKVFLSNCRRHRD